MAPVSVCHQVSTIGTAPLADVLVVPDPGFGVDRLADRPHQAQRGQIVLVDVLVSPLHERPDRGGGGVEDGHPVVVDDLPETVEIGVVGGTLVDDRGGPVGQRPVDDVAVPGDPADVGGAPVHVAVGFEVEHQGVGGGDPGQVTGLGVDDPLRLPRGPRCVEDVEGVFGVEDLGLTVLRLTVDQVVPPDVTPLHHLHAVIGASHDDRVGDVRGRSSASSVFTFSGTTLPPRHAPSWVITTRQSESRIRDRQGVGGEPAEHDRVDQAEPGAGQHGDRQLRDHPHVDGDPIALAQTEALEPVGEPAHLGGEVGVGDGASVAGLTHPVVGNLVAMLGEMPIEAVVRQVELPVLEPLEEGRVGVVEDFCRRGEPGDALQRLLLPEGLVVERPPLRGCRGRRWPVR